MVIGDDHVRAQLIDILRLFGTGNTAVHRNEQLGLTILENAVHRFHGQPVAIGAFGDVNFRLNAEIAECVVHNGGGADAVRVVIAEHHHRPSLVAGLFNQFHRLFHPFHEKGGKKIFPGRMHEFPDRVRCIHAPRVQNPDDVFGQARFAGKP